MRILLAVIMVLALSSIAYADPIEWSFASGGNGHYYDLVTFTNVFLNWTESRDLASTMIWQGVHGHLVTLTSKAENDWVWSNLGGPWAYYLGGFQIKGAIEPDDGWQWITGEPWSFTNWAPGEPNNVTSGPSGSEDILEFAAWGLWNDNDMQQGPINYRLGFVVEYDFGSVPVQPTTWGHIKALYE